MGYNYDAEATRADDEAVYLDGWDDERSGHLPECPRHTDPYGMCVCDD